MNLEIITNNQPRELMCGSELTDAERAEFDYIPDSDLFDHDFIRYKGVLYDLHDTCFIDRNRECLPDGFEHWDSYVGDTFFSGVLFKYTQDATQVICGRYMS